MKKHIPNTITCCNLLCGCIAVSFALQAEPRYDLALAFIIIGNVFDFFDGFAARLLRVASPVGKELDSLADVVTSGLAPASMLFALLREMPPAAGGFVGPYLPYAAFLITAFSALRLAKFNLDQRQTSSFIGLPTPANALFWGALIVGNHAWFCQNPWSAWLLLAGVLLSCWLLVAELPMFALKFKHFRWNGNALRYTFILVSAALLILLGWTAFSAIVLVYVITSIIAELQRK